MSDKILFFKIKEPFGLFSNFDTKHPIVLKGKSWKSTEHYYQSQKFAGTEFEEVVRLKKTPREAADTGRDKCLPLRSDWESVKDNVMRDAIRAKFTQHNDLKELLLSTGDSEICEHTNVESYWSDGGDGTGKNMLGKILVEIREELRNNKQ